MKTKNFILVGIVAFILVSNTNLVCANTINFFNLIGDGNTLYVGGVGPDNYSSINEAIDDASDGDTVFVFHDSSPYIENVMIWKQIVLIGEDRDATIIDGNNSGNVITVAKDWVAISELTIQNGIVGIYIDGHSNITITANIVQDNRDEGITFHSACDYNTVSNNIISDNGLIGLAFTSFSDYNTISENVIKNHVNGTSLAGFAYGEIYGNSFEDNTEYGLVLSLWCNENEIHQNNFIGNSRHAIFFIASLNKWNFNYWDRPRILPKPILGFFGIIPWIKFDWRPLLKPHEIPG